MEANHNLEITTSRVGGFGSSDAKLFYKIGLRGLESLNNTDKKRIRVAKGIDEYKPVAVNDAMQKGHDFEDWYEKTQLPKHENWEREVKLSKQLANNFDTFFHADFYNETFKNVLELKCVSEPQKARDNYYEQLQWQIMIWDCSVFLVVCDSNYTDFQDGLSAIQSIAPNKEVIETLKKGIKLLDEAWDTIDLTIGEEWEESDLLFFDKPEVVAMYNYLSEIKTIEAKAEEQKAKVLQIMLDNGISSLKSDLYSITLIPEGTSSTFDKKKMLSEHPEIDEKKYTKNSVRKAYIKVALR